MKNGGKRLLDNEIFLVGYSGEIYSSKRVYNHKNYPYPMQRYNIPEQFIMEEYFNKLKSQQEIASALGVSQWVISQRMLQYHIKSRERTWKIHLKKYSVNESFFNHINENVAWVLGWLATDGYVTKDGSFGLKVNKRDADVILKIKQLLEYSGPTYNYKTILKKTNKKYNLVQLKINSKKMANKLISFGIIPNKSLTLRFPNVIKKVNQEIITKSFIRGAFEGDGSILFTKKPKSLLFQIVGTKEFLTEIQKYLIKYLRLNRTVLTKNKQCCNHFALRYRGNIQALRIFDWLYLDLEQYYLERKHNKYLNIKRCLKI